MKLIIAGSACWLVYTTMRIAWLNVSPIAAFFVGIAVFAMCISWVAGMVEGA